MKKRISRSKSDTQRNLNMGSLENLGEDDLTYFNLPRDILEANNLLDLISDIIIDDMQPSTSPQKPYVVITEHPHPKLNRFRYECEGRLAGSIVGVRTTREQKTHPSIEIRGFKGRAVVVVSCVTKDPPYRPHPHGLVGKERCNRGVCTVEINSNTMSHTFHLGVQCVRKRDIAEALRIREEIRVDPFRTGYSHARQPATIDLSAVRLSFQVFLEGSQRGRFTEPLAPVVSEVFHDKKSTTMSELVICRLSDCIAPVTGGKKIILLCERVVKEDISVRFYEEKNGAILWEATGEFQQTSVHKQVAICFTTPRYRSIDVDHSVMVHIQLVRPSDGATSEPRQFELKPADLGNLNQKRKRPMFHNWNVLDTSSDVAQNAYRNPTQQSPLEAIKSEPEGSPSNPFFAYQMTTPSPTSLGAMNPTGSVSPYLSMAPSGSNTAAPAVPSASCQLLPTSPDFFHQETEPFQLNFNTPSLGNDISLNVQQLGQLPAQEQQYFTGFNLPFTDDHQQLQSIQPGPSEPTAVAVNPPQDGATTEFNLSSLLEMNIGMIDSSEIRSLVNNFTENPPG